jgi:hypothetical protein
MATSAQAGNWNLPSTWVGGVVPGAGDRAVLAHEVTVSDARTIGTSPAATGGPTTFDLEIKAAGRLKIVAGGVLTLRGYGMARWSSVVDFAVDMDGGVLQFDSTQAPSPATDGYDFYTGDGLWQYRRWRLRNGATIRSVAGAARGLIALNAGNQGVSIDAQGSPAAPVVFERLGRSETAFSAVFGAGPNDPRLPVLLQDVVFRDCFLFRVGGTQDVDHVLRRVTVLGTPGESSIAAYDTPTTAGVTHLIEDCSFERLAKFTPAPGFAVRDTVFAGGRTRSGNAMASLSGNLTQIQPGGANTHLSLSETDEYILTYRAEGNQKAFMAGVPGGAAGSTITRMTVEFTNDAAAGDPVSDGEAIAHLAPDYGPVTFRELLHIPQRMPAGANRSCEWVNDFPSRATFIRCTLPSALGFGHSGDTGIRTDRADLRDSIIARFADGGVGGWKVEFISFDHADPVLPANVHHNCGYRLLASRYPGAGGIGYGTKQTDPAAPIGVGDVDVDPWPHWPTDPAARREQLPRMKSYGQQVLGLSGTSAQVEDAVLRAMLVRHLPGEAGHLGTTVTPAAMRTWVRARWAPSNPALATASSTGGWMGAIDGTATATDPLENAQVGDTGPFSAGTPGLDVTKHVTPNLGTSAFFQQGNSPLRWIATPSRGLPASRHSDAIMAFFRDGGGSNQTIWSGSFYSQIGSGMPLSVVRSGVTPRVPVVYEGGDASEVNVYNSDPGPYPIPDTARIQGYWHAAPPTEEIGGDSHLIVLDADTGDVFEAYKAHKKADGSGWSAYNGFSYNLLTGRWAPHIDDPAHPNYVAPDGHRFPSVIVTAATLPVLPLSVRYEELYVLGEILHKIGFTLNNTKIGGCWAWPALGMAWSNRNRVDSGWGPTMPYGANLRLRDEWYRANVEAADGTPLGGWGPGTRVLLRCFNEYGIVLTDGGTNADLWAIADSRFWTENRWETDLQQLRDVPFGEFEVMDYEDEVIVLEVTPAVAPVGVQRTVTVESRLWELHPQAHPGNPDHVSPDGGKWFRYAVGMSDPVTRLWAGTIAPGETMVGEGGVLAQITPEHPAAAFRYTPTLDNPMVVPFTLPPCLPYAYLDGPTVVHTTQDEPITLTITPAAATIPDGGSVTFHADVAGTGQNAVWWFTSFPGGGTPYVDSPIDWNTGVFTHTGNGTTGTVTARLVADQRISATTTLSIASGTVAVSVTPPTATVPAGGTQQFSATVTGSGNTAVTWSVSGGGTISPGGLYTAPATTGKGTVTAISVADPTKYASASVTVGAAGAVSVSVTPDAATLTVNGTRQFAATVTGSTNTAVTWSVAGGGTISNAGLYAAPGVAGSATIRATSAADPSKFDESAVVIEAATPPQPETGRRGRPDELVATEAPAGLNFRWPRAAGRGSSSGSRGR